MAINNQSSVRIVSGSVRDIRFPTSKELAGSDAMHPDPDYSCAYVELSTDHPPLKGYGLTFTLGRGNELCVAAAQYFCTQLEEVELCTVLADFGGFWHRLVNDSQYRWLGPEKGVVHLAAAAVVNALWDLWARLEEKPLWQLVVELTPEQLVSCIDFTYISDVISPGQATELLQKKRRGYQDRLERLKTRGIPAYTTTPGWLGYSDERLRQLCLEARQAGWRAVKLKVGTNLKDDIRRCSIARQVLGDSCRIMVDANQRWEVREAVEWMRALEPFGPWWIEEPTSPDDILGHKTIREALAPDGIKVATGEQCHNRIMFKQLIQHGAIDICQIDSCRLGGVNEVLAVLLMAALFDIPVCPHAGGVGLCEYVQHLAAIDYLCMGSSDRSAEQRMVEYVEHLHEHFTDPVIMDGPCYQLPEKPGYSARMHSNSLEQYHYPNGHYWRDRAMIDAHQHFWSPARNDYGWLTSGMTRLYRDYQPEHLVPLMQECGIAGTVLVQAAPTIEETRYLLGLAESTPWVKAVVGWLPMADDAFEALLAKLLANLQCSLLKGVRPMLQDMDDPEWVISPKLDHSFQVLIDTGLTFDALVKPPQWQSLLQRLVKHPELRVVIDHGAKPDIKNQAFSQWRDMMTLLAGETSACCKLSGLWSEAGKAVDLQELRPWLDVIFDCFGPGRILWGSDWPVINNTGSYQGWLELCQCYCVQFSPEERKKIFMDNALGFYQSQCQ